MNNYLTMKQQHQKEFNEFPFMFAFSNSQFEEGMKKLELDPKDTDKIYSIGGGGYIKKTDSDLLDEMTDRHDKEFKNAIAEDLTGEDFIFQMFDYELSNHEFTYTGSITDTLNALGITREEIATNESLTNGLDKAIKSQWANCKE